MKFVPVGPKPASLRRRPGTRLHFAANDDRPPLMEWSRAALIEALRSSDTLATDVLRAAVVDEKTRAVVADVFVEAGLPVPPWCAAVLRAPYR
jgi:hypothetical protein